MILKQIHKIFLIGMFAVVIGIMTVGPVMADDDDEDERKKKKKIDICHFDNEDGKYVELSIKEKKAKGHAKNHDDDLIPAPDDGCPEQAETENESDDGINMDEFMDDFTRHDDILMEITNSECSVGEVVTGFGPNGELLCSLDNSGEDLSYNILSRTFPFELPSDKNWFDAYLCEPGEIMLGGIIEMPPLETPISNSGEIISGSEQRFEISIDTNRTPDPVPVDVIILCFSAI